MNIKGKHLDSRRKGRRKQYSDWVIIYHIHSYVCLFFRLGFENLLFICVNIKPHYSVTIFIVHFRIFCRRIMFEVLCRSEIEADADSPIILRYEDHATTKEKHCSCNAQARHIIKV